MRIIRIVNAVFWRIIYCLANNIEVRYDAPKVGLLVESIRINSLKKIGAVIGRDSWVRFHSYIVNPQYILIGAHSKIGVGAKLFLYDQFIVGDRVEIGSGLTVHTAEHKISDATVPLCKQGAIYAPVIIDSDVYIGSNVIILPGTIIKTRVVVGAGAVVKGILETGYVYGGVPARKIKQL